MPDLRRSPLDLEEKKLREEGAVQMRKAMKGVAAKEKEFVEGDSVVLQDPSTGKWSREATVGNPKRGAGSTRSLQSPPVSPWLRQM